MSSDSGEETIHTHALLQISINRKQHNHSQNEAKQNPRHDTWQNTNDDHETRHLKLPRSA